MPPDVFFDDKSTPGPSGPIQTWAWEFGDGETSSEQEPTHHYDDGGDYNVKLTVTGTPPDGYDDIIHTITVPAAPPPPPPPPPPPGGEFGIWAWDAQSLDVDPNSAAFIASMLATTPAGYVAAMEAKGVASDHSQCYLRHGTALDGFDQDFWIPNGSLPGLSVDRHFAVVDTVTGRTTDMWKATLGSDGKIDTWSGGRTYPTSPVVAYLEKMTKTGANTTTNASSVPALPSCLTPADIEAGIASHTLTFTCYHPGPGVATSKSRGNRYPAAPWGMPWPGVAANPPLGTMIRLPQSANLGAGAGILEECIFNTLKKYGAILRDNGPNVTFKAIDPGGGGKSASAWDAVGCSLRLTGGGVLSSKGVSGDKMTRIPWSQLQVTVPPGNYP